jgi:hypothetical protein
MSLSNTVALQQIQGIHDYLIATGHITTQWFFFAGTVNAAVAGWLVQSGRVERAGAIPGLFVLCDLALAVMYCPLVPLYYRFARRNIAKLIDRLDAGNEVATLPAAFPFGYWVAASIALAIIMMLMAGLWYYFFFTEAGLARLVKFAKGS